MNKYLLCIPLIVLHPMSAFAANQAKFGLVAKTPTTLTVPVNRKTFVQYVVTNNTAVTRTLTIIPIPGLTQQTQNNSECSNPFTLSQGQTCRLTFVVEGSQINGPVTGGPIVCKTQSNSTLPDTTFCSQPEQDMALSITPALPVTPTANKLYVSNWDGDSITLCYLNAGTPTDCLVSATSSTFAKPEALAVRNNVLFVANIGGGMSSCRIDAVSGELSNCINPAAQNAPIHAPDGIAIDGTTAYISNSGPILPQQGVTTCTINDNLLDNCAFTQGNASFSIPSDLGIVNNTLYVTNFNSQNLQTTYCTLGGSLCSTATGTGFITGTGNLLNQPEGLSFTNLNGVDYAYFTNNGNNTVVVCQVQSPTNFANCAVTNGYFFGFGNLAVLTTAAKAYIPSGLHKLSTCDVSTTDGTLSNCIVSSEVNFTNPSGILVQ